jgi:hypothetical protein
MANCLDALMRQRQFQYLFRNLTRISKEFPFCAALPSIWKGTMKWKAEQGTETDLRELASFFVECPFSAELCAFQDILDIISLRGIDHWLSLVIFLPIDPFQIYKYIDMSTILVPDILHAIQNWGEPSRKRKAQNIVFTYIHHKKLYNMVLGTQFLSDYLETCFENNWIPKMIHEAIAIGR